MARSMMMMAIAFINCDMGLVSGIHGQEHYETLIPSQAPQDDPDAMYKTRLPAAYKVHQEVEIRCEQSGREWVKGVVGDICDGRSKCRWGLPNYRYTHRFLIFFDYGGKSWQISEPADSMYVRSITHSSFQTFVSDCQSFFSKLLLQGCGVSNGHNDVGNINYGAAFLAPNDNNSRTRID